MKVNTNYETAFKMRSASNQNVVNKPAFKANYTKIRSLSDAIYENSNGSRKVLLYLYRKSGEMLNNWVTFFGTAAIAPIFIAFNPMSKEDKDSKYYTSLRQPISAGITIATQYWVMTKFNNLLDRHAASFGVDEIDLSAKPPKAALLPRLKQEYRTYYADCIRNGEEPEKKKDWINKKVREMQDRAFYDTLSERRKTMDVSKIKTKDLVKLDMLNDKRKACYKDVLKNDFGFNEEALKVLPEKDYNEFVKYHVKKVAKARNLDYHTILDKIDAKAMEKAVKELDAQIEYEAHVKLETSKIRAELLEKYNNEVASKSLSPSELHSKKLEIYKNKLNNLKREYESILRVKAVPLSEEQKIKKDVYEKLLAHIHEPIVGLKDHGLTLDSARRSVIIKKDLINHINKAEAKFKGFKDRAGVIVGLLILPATCGILNWAYPRIMEKLFPKLSAAKAASKAKQLGIQQPASDADKKAKEVK